MSIEQALFLYVVIIFSAIIHEYSHGWMAYQEGDPTAKYAGRLTLNPIPHMDSFGTIILPLLLLVGFPLILGTSPFFFGYAKPVPINPNNFRDQRRGLILVSLAGPGSNFLVAIILGLLVRFFPGLAIGGLSVIPFIAFITFVNIWLGLFNLIPVPPLDGSKLLFGLAAGRGGALDFLRGAGSWFGILFALFIAFTFLPYLGNLIFTLITGGNIAM
ncbi:MAG: site-2 protease family protein [bacterium]